MKYLFISFTTLCMALGLANTSAIADNIPSNAAKDKRDSVKAGNKLSRAVSAQCDGNGKTRGKEYQKVWKEIRKLCKGSHIGDGCSISGKGDSFLLMPIENKKTRMSEKAVRYPGDFKKVLGKYCHDQ